jgi:excisionase family DNA binding protein
MGYIQDSAFIPFEPRIGRSVSLDQACQVLQVSRRTVYNWIREGRLRTIRTLGGSQRVLIESLRQATEGMTSAVQ